MPRINDVRISRVNYSTGKNIEPLVNIHKAQSTAPGAHTLVSDIPWDVPLPNLPFDPVEMFERIIEI